MKNNCITIKEFEFITKERNLYEKDSDRYHCIDENYFVELLEFCRSQTEVDSEGNPLDFLKVYTKKGIGEVVQAKNNVGIIQLKSGFQVQILPKIDMQNGLDSTKNTECIFIDMLRSMKDFPGKVFSSANLRTESINLYEIFINMYIYQVSLLTRKGLKSAYLQQEGNLNIFKGKLLINEHIKRNIGHSERFFLAFDEYELNRPENKIIKATLLKLGKISSSSNNIKEIKRQLLYFENVEPSVNYNHDFSKIIIDRQNRNYEEILNWSKIFLFDKSFSTFSGKNNARALLFPMEKVYESFVSKYIDEIFSESGFTIQTQDTGKYLFKEKDKNIFSLKPDIVISNRKKIKIIMDTKWKRLYDNSAQNYGISQSDIYQMYAYSKKYESEDVWLLYPMVNDFRRHEKIIFRDEKGTRISIFFIDVSDIENSINELLLHVKEQYFEYNSTY